MSLENMASASYEKRQQRILQLRQMFNQLKIITVAQASQYFGYQIPTITKWATDGNIPLIIDNHTTVVPLTMDNAPAQCKTTDAGAIFFKQLQLHSK